MPYQKLRYLQRFGPPVPDDSGNDNSDNVSEEPPIAMAPAQNAAPSQQQLPPFDVASRLAQMYKPQNTAETAYINNLNAMPNRADFHPGALDKILSAIAGMGTGGPTSHWGGQPVGYQGNPGAAFQVSSGLLNQPFEQKMGDWETKNKALAGASGIENQRNVGELRAAHEQISNELTNRARDLTQERLNFERDKSSDIKQYKYDKMEQDLNLAHQQAEDLRARYQADMNNKDRLYELRQQEDKVKQLDFMMNYNKAMDELKKQKEQFEANQKRLREEFEKNLGFRGEQLNRTTEKVTTGPDASGKIISKTERTSHVPSVINRQVQDQVEKKITMVGPDGSEHLVPESKVQDAIKNYQMKVKQ